ncbi:MAG: Stp1/IreP family PP2C-type Ser/Thr phosphatase, partial [Gaiellaceae bacterium]
MLRVAEYHDRTDTGRARRVNEDARFARAPLFVIADGMGGAQAGEVASSTAIEVMASGLEEGRGSVEERLVARVAEANERIFAMSARDRDLSGMGTTVTAAYVGENEVSIAHVGDSRAYLLRDGSLERLTEDHTLVEEFVRQGKLTPEEADAHPQRSIITRALGIEPGVAVDRLSVRGRDGDVFLLCSDGLTGMVPEPRVAEIIRAAATAEEATRGLVDAANDAGGRDNITAIVFRLEQLDAAAPDAGGATQHTIAGRGGPSTAEVRAAAM